MAAEARAKKIEVRPKTIEAKPKKVHPDWPEAYKQGYQDFYGRQFIVTKDVLIPRPETEMVVDAVLNLFGETSLPGVRPGRRQVRVCASILDVGTGSGCIAVTLKKLLPKARVIGTDISRRAIKVARRNAELHFANAKFIQADLLTHVRGDFDIIVANLPYVDESWSWLNLKALSAEPRLALFADDGGLALIKKLIRQIPPATTFLVLEADRSQHQRIIDYAKQYDFELFETRDFALTLSRKRNLA